MVGTSSLLKCPPGLRRTQTGLRRSQRKEYDMDTAMAPLVRGGMGRLGPQAVSRPTQRVMQTYRERAIADASRVHCVAYVGHAALNAIGLVVHAEGQYSSLYPNAEPYFRSVVMNVAAVANQIVAEWTLP